MANPITDAIRTVVYRSEPGTREYVYNGPSPMGGPGIADSNERQAPAMQDWQSYLGQLIRATHDAGGTLENSPQLQSLYARHDAIGNALAKQGAVAADMAQARAQQTQADALMKEADFKQSDAGLRFAYTNNPQSIALDPTGAARVGIPVAPEALLQTLGVGPKESLDQATAKYMGRGMGPLQAGDPLHGAFMGRYGPDIEAGLAGKPTGWMGGWFGGDKAATARQGQLQKMLGVQAPPRPQVGVPPSFSSVPPAAPAPSMPPRNPGLDAMLGTAFPATVPSQAPRPVRPGYVPPAHLIPGIRRKQDLNMTRFHDIQRGGSL